MWEHRIKIPIVSSRRASPQEIQRVIGLWSWPLLICLPPFYVLFHEYQFMLEADPDRRRRLPDTAISEFSVFVDLFPLLYDDLSRPLSSTVYASDASEKAAGIVYADLSTSDLWRFKTNIAGNRCRKGWYTTLLTLPRRDSEFISSVESASRRKMRVSKRFEKAIQAVKFKTAVSSKRQWSGDKIDKLETEAYILGLRRMESSPNTRGKRII